MYGKAKIIQKKSKYLKNICFIYSNIKTISQPLLELKFMIFLKVKLFFCSLVQHTTTDRSIFEC